MDININKSLSSLPAALFNHRFVVKVSTLQKIRTEMSVMVFVYDTVEDTSKIVYFSDEDKACSFINLLKSVT